MWGVCWTEHVPPGCWGGLDEFGREMLLLEGEEMHSCVC